MWTWWYGRLTVKLCANSALCQGLVLHPSWFSTLNCISSLFLTEFFSIWSQKLVLICRIHVWVMHMHPLWASLVAQAVMNLPAIQKRLGFHPWLGTIPWRRKWQPTPVFLPGESQGQRSLVGYSPWDGKELDMTERLTLLLHCKGVHEAPNTAKRWYLNPGQFFIIVMSTPAYGKKPFVPPNKSLFFSQFWPSLYKPDSHK